MFFKPDVAAPFEVSRRINFYAPKRDDEPVFAGAVALRVLREKWADMQENDEHLQKVRHPQLTGMSVILLHRSEVHKALVIENDEAEPEDTPVYNQKHAQKVTKQIGKLISKRKVLSNINPPTSLEHVTGLDNEQHIFMPMPWDEADRASLVLERERDKCIDILSTITKRDPHKIEEPLGPAIMIGVLGTDILPEKTATLYHEMNTAVLSMVLRAQTIPGYPLSPLQLARPEIVL